MQITMQAFGWQLVLRRVEPRPARPLIREERKLLDAAEVQRREDVLQRIHAQRRALDRLSGKAI